MLRFMFSNYILVFLYRFKKSIEYIKNFYYIIITMKAKNNLIPVTLLTGYLGAGKTTLLNYVLNNQKGYKVAVIVNDIGEVNIDAALISKEASIVEEDKDALVPLQNGCICCTLKTDLMNQIVSLAETGKFDYILIEASGICEPMPIAQSIMALSGETGDKSIPAVVKLDNIVTVVDALRLVTEFAGGNSLLNKNLDEEDIEGLLIQQIEFCNTILINKTDLVSEEQLKEVKAVVKTLQPSANMIETQKGVVDLSKILGTNSFDFEKVYSTAGWIKKLEEHDAEHHEPGEHLHEHHHEHDENCDCGCHDHNHEHHHEHGEKCSCGCHHHHHGEGEAEEYGIGTFVYYVRRPFDRAKLERFAENWPATVIRTKGLVWFSDVNDEAYVLEQAGKQITCGYSGDWMATAPKGQIKKALASDPEFAKNWDEKLGDRMVKLVFIGRKMDKAKICADLDACTIEPKL